MKSFAFPFKPVLAAIASAMVCTSSFAMVTDQDKAGTVKAQNEQKLTQIIVKYRNDASSQVAAAAAGQKSSVNAQIQAQRLSTLQSVGQSFGAQFDVDRQIVTGGWVFRSSTPMTPAKMRALARKLAKSDPSIEYAEPDYIYYPTFVPTDPLYSSAQWDMQDSKSQVGALNLPTAWDSSMGANTVVAVLDTGYRPHPDLLPNLIPAPGGAANQYGYNFISNAARARITLPAGVTSARGPDALDMGDWCGSRSSSWHGTHVAGTVAAAGNDIGVIGVAPKARILPLRVLGQCGGSNSDIADAVAWASGIAVPNTPKNTTPAQVINMSLGGVGECTKTSAAAFQKAMANGTVIAVAAGNSAYDAKLSSPANCAGVITVAATSIAGGRASYSNYGGTVTVAAPGGGFTTANDMITSTLPTGATVSTNDTTYGFMAGTSQATPHVAGVIALMLSVNPKLTPAQVKSILIKTARPAPANCQGCGSGIVDAAAAVKAASGS